MITFPDSKLANMKVACALSIQEYGNQDARDILDLALRLEAAERALQYVLECGDLPCLFADREPDEVAVWRLISGKKTIEPHGHEDTGLRCLVYHPQHGSCIKCSCGQFIAPGEWESHTL